MRIIVVNPYPIDVDSVKTHRPRFLANHLAPHFIRSWQLADLFFFFFFWEEIV
jgi:hypothetical protein